MTTIADRRITGGVDTHLDVHVAAALDERGALLGVERFATTIAGYRGTACVGSTPSATGARRRRRHRQLRGGLTRHLHRDQVAVVEVDRPNRQRHRRTGKSDPKTPGRRGPSRPGG